MTKTRNQLRRTAVDDAQRADTLRMKRRDFIKVIAAVGGGLLLEVSLPVKLRAATVTQAVLNSKPATIAIGSDESVVLTVPGGEMGQGANGVLAQILSEELPLDLNTGVRTVPAPFGAQFTMSGGQITGGSQTVRSYFDPMLDAGALARSLLVAAAAQRWGVDASKLTAVKGGVVNGTYLPNRVVDGSGNYLTYGSLAADAAKLTPPLSVARISSANSYQVIGTSQIRPDIREKVNGQAVFGIDVIRPGMMFAAVRHGPALGQKVATMGNAPSGMLAVNLDTAVAVVASNTWAAMNAVKSLPVTWTALTTTQQNLLDTSTQNSNLTSLLSSTSKYVCEQVPSTATSTSVLSVINSTTLSPKKLTATYTFPMLAHACMEVVNCTVEVAWNADKTAATSVNVWCPTQAPDMVASTVGSVFPNVPVSVTTTYMGGGFGRKIEQDYVLQAARVALAAKVPVKLMWPREEDFGRDWCRPAAASKIQVGLDANGNITGWYNRIAAPSVLRAHNWAGGANSSFSDGIAIGSAVGNIGDESLPYAAAMGTRVVEYTEQTTGFSTGFWRSVGQSISCFAVESAIDECAKLAGIGPYEYRLKLAAGNARMLGVLKDVYDLSNWATPAPAGTARGLALSPGFGSFCGMVAEVTKVVVGTVTSYKVSRVFCSVDCGTAVNPDQVKAQIEGGIHYAMNAARWGRMQYDKGIPQIKNFGDYKMGRMSDSPQVVVRILKGSTLGGIGEVAVPPVAPALANAYAALTGTRKRALPLGF